LPQAQRRAMVTPSPQSTNPAYPGEGYGLGMGIERESCGMIYDHPGGLPGYRAFVARTRDGTRTGVLLLNGSPLDTDEQRVNQLFHRALCR
jgi:hypothetical protein